MKDHEIAGLVNALRDRLNTIPVFSRYGPLREVISSTVMTYLRLHGLRYPTEVDKELEIAKRMVTVLAAELERATASRIDRDDLIYDLFNQACNTSTEETPRFNHQMLSAYEEAQKHLIKVGRIDAAHCVYQ